MKKIIALAVAAVVAAPAMADLTLSGGVSAGYATNSGTFYTDATTYANAAGTGAATVTRSADKGDGGFGVDSAGIAISGSETLESGLTVAGSISAGGFKRGSSVGGENASLSVSGGFGSLTIGELELGNGVFGYGTGAVTEDFTGELVGAASNFTSVKYVAPAMGMATVSVGFSEAVGYGVGEDSTVAPDVNVALAVNEMVSLWANYRPEKDAVAARTRVGGSFSTAGLTLKAAIGMNDDAANNTNTAIGASYAMGATTFGVGYGKNTTDAVAAGVLSYTDGTGTKTTPARVATSDTGISYGFKHALSSNVAIAGKYTTFDATNDRTGVTSEGTKTNLTLSLSF